MSTTGTAGTAGTTGTTGTTAAVAAVAAGGTPTTASAAPAPATVSPPASVAQGSTVAAPATTAAAPHFTTPAAAMRYLADAYNRGDETAIRHVTTPDSRQQFEAERQWVTRFSFRDCTPNGAPSWDYTCVLNIDAYVPGASPTPDPGSDAATVQAMNEVTLLVGAAARPGYYVEANEGCGGG